jgi:hypothetical protein
MSPSTTTCKRIGKPSLKEILLVFLIVFAAYAYFSMETDANANSRLALVRAIVEEHRFQIDSYQGTSLPTSDKASFNGHYYSDKAIGSSLIGIPIYSMMLGLKSWLRLSAPNTSLILLLPIFVVSLFSALLAPLIYVFGRRITGDPWTSLLMTIVICLGTPYFVYSTTYYGHTLAGLLLFLAFFIWLDSRNKNQFGPGPTTLSGFLLGVAIVTEYPTFLIAAVIWLYILYVLGKSGHILDLKLHALLIIGALIPILVLLYYNYSIFKNPFTISYSHEASQDFYTVQNTGLMGIGLPNPLILFYMTFHTTMGIFWQSPVLLLAFFGWLAATKNHEYLPEAVFAFAVILVYLVVFSGYHTWWGGLAFTPRHLIPALPFFAVPLILLPKSFRVPTIILGLISVCQMFIVAAASRQGLSAITQFTSGFYRMFENSTIYNVYFANFRSQLLTGNRGQQLFGLTGFTSLAPLIITEAILLIAFFILARTPRTPRVDEKC